MSINGLNWTFAKVQIKHKTGEKNAIAVFPTPRSADFSGKKDYLFGGEIFAANGLHGGLLKMFQDEWDPN